MYQAHTMEETQVPSSPTFHQQKETRDGILTLLNKALHVTAILLVFAASLLPWVKKLEDIRFLCSLYLIFSSCVLDIQLRALQLVQEISNTLCYVEMHYIWFQEEFVTFAWVGLWYLVSPIFKFIDEAQDYLRNSSKEQIRSHFQLHLILASQLVTEIEQHRPTSPTSSSASSFISTPSSSPQSTPISSRVNTYVRVVENKDTFEEDLSDSANESVGNLLASQLVVRKPSSSSLLAASRTLLHSASIKHLTPTASSASTIRRKVSTASRASLNPAKAAESALVEVTQFQQRVVQRTEAQPQAQLQLQNGEKQKGKNSKVAKVAKKWVGKVKVFVKGGKGQAGGKKGGEADATAA